MPGGAAPPSLPAATLLDDELTAEALAADPDAELDDDAVCLWDVWEGAAGPEEHLLPGWYMPSPAAGPVPGLGWRRLVVLAVIISFLAINAYGLCSTYGQVGLG